MAIDNGKAVDLIGAGIAAGMHDLARWYPRWRIERYANEEAYLRGDPYDVTDFEGNVLLNSGINRMWELIAGANSNVYNNANAQLGVGSDSTAASPTQTGLLDAGAVYKGMETGFPQVGSNQQIVFRSVFGANDANFNWREFAVKHATSGVHLNRVVSNQGTKAAGQVWTLTLTISLS